MIKLLRMLRLLKLLRLARLNRLISRYEEEFASLMTTFKLAKLVVLIIVVGHWYVLPEHSEKLQSGAETFVWCAFAHVLLLQSQAKLSLFWHRQHGR